MAFKPVLADANCVFSSLLASVKLRHSCHINNFFDRQPIFLKTILLLSAKYFYRHASTIRQMTCKSQKVSKSVDK